MKEKILQLREQGYTYNQIVKELGCAKSTVAYHVGPGQKEKWMERTAKKSNKIRLYLREYKENLGCLDCGEKYPFFMLDFDHRPGEEKMFNLSHLRQFSSMEKVLEEIEKCDVVCANCHRIRTWRRHGGDKV